MSIGKRVRGFVADEQGSATVWNLTWLIGFGIMGGLSIDGTNGWRHKAMHQSTADVAALAGVYSLPYEKEAVDEALAFAEINMSKSDFGTYLAKEDVQLGRWIHDERNFDPNDGPSNAVRIKTEQSVARKNPVGANLLRLIGFSRWEIRTEAIAAIHSERCIDGLISNENIETQSGNLFQDGYCIYGRNYIQVQNGNDFSGGDNDPATHAWVGVGPGATEDCGLYNGLRLGGSLGNHCSMDSNPQLEDAQFVSDTIWPFRLYAHEISSDGEIGVILDDNGQPTYTLGAQIAALIDDARGSGTFLPQPQWLSGNGLTTDVQAMLQDGGKFYLRCNNDNKVLKLPNAVYEKPLLLTTNCPVRLPGGGSGSSFAGVTIATSYLGNAKAVDIAGGNIFGKGCGPDEGFHIMTEGDVYLSGNNRHMGTKVTAGGDVDVAGNNDSWPDVDHALSVHAGGAISVSSSSSFGGCENRWTGINKVYALVH